MESLVIRESKYNVLEDIVHLDIGDDPLSPTPKASKRLSSTKQQYHNSKVAIEENSSHQRLLNHLTSLDDN
jgi:hypothetical protein